MLGNSARLSREWLSEHFGTDLDEMSATQVLKRGWTEEEIIELEACIQKWNRFFSRYAYPNWDGFEQVPLDFRLMSYKDEIQLPRFAHRLTSSFSENGVLYLNRCGSNFMSCKDIFVAHEIGHYLEQLEGGFIDSHALRRTMNKYRTPGLMYHIEYSSMFNRNFIEESEYTLPPSNVPYRHDNDVLHILEDLEKFVGYNFRQVTCDSLAFQNPHLGIWGHSVGRFEHRRLKQLAEQYIIYVELVRPDYANVGQRLSRHYIPEIARLVAGTWAIRDLSTQVLRDADISYRAQRLIGTYIPQGLRPDDRNPEIRNSFDELLGNNFDRLEYFAALVLIRAYRDHFLTCIGLPALFSETRIEPHLERIDPVKTPDLRVRLSELMLLSKMKDVRCRDAIIGLLDDPHDLIRHQAFEVLMYLTKGNPNDPTILGILPQVVYHRLFDTHAGGYAGHIWDDCMQKNNSTPHALRCLPVILEYLTNTSRKEAVGDFWISNVRDALSMWGDIVAGHPGSREILDQTHVVANWIDVSYKEDIHGDAKYAALRAWGLAAAVNPRSHVVLRFLPTVIDKFATPQQDHFVPHAALQAYQRAAKANPGELLILSGLSAVVALLDTDDENTLEDGIRTWETLQEANPQAPGIIESAIVHEEAKKRWRRSKLS